MYRSIIAAVTVAVLCLAPGPGTAHRTSRTHYHTVNGQRVWHKASQPSVHWKVYGWRGHIARSTTLKNRNLVIDFDNGHRRTVEVPQDIPVVKNGKRVSVHNLPSDTRVRVWAYRIPNAEGAWRATRIQAYDKA